MRVYGLLGHNISYSLSPVMHNAAFKKLNIKAEYTLFDIAPENVDSFLNGLLRSNINGLNVTVPYKINAYEFASKYGVVDEESRYTGAVNTIALKKSSISAYNTDVFGFMRALKVDLRFNPKKKNVIVLGAGGAGTACAMKIAQECQKVYIFDVDILKLKTFEERFLKFFRKSKLCVVRDVKTDLKGAIAECHLLVNATPFGRRRDQMLVHPSFLHKNLCIYDLIYSPRVTPVVSKAKSMGLRGATGAGMLLYQGAKAFEIWTGKKAPIRTMKQALLKALRNK